MSTLADPRVSIHDGTLWLEANAANEAVMQSAREAHDNFVRMRADLVKNHADRYNALLNETANLREYARKTRGMPEQVAGYQEEIAVLRSQNEALKKTNVDLVVEIGALRARMPHAKVKAKK